MAEPTPKTSSTAVASAASVWRRWRRRIVITAAICLVVGIAIFLLLPVWASTERGRAFVLGRINRGLHGTVDCANWRLGWFHGIEIDGLTLTNAQGQRIFECRQITTDLTLWGYLRGSYALGTTRVVEPVLNVNKYADGGNDLQQIFALTHPGQPDRVEAWFGSLSGLIQIARGTVTLSATGTAPALHFANVAAEIPIASPQAHIHVSLRAGPDAQPTLTAEGNFPPLETWRANPGELSQDLELHAGNLPVAALARWMNLRPQWQVAMGPAISSLYFLSHPQGAAATADLELSAPNGSIESRIQIEPHDGTLILSVPDANHYARLNGRMSEPAAAWLRYINPLFAQAVPGTGTVTVSFSSARVDLRNPESATASAQLFCDHLELQPGGLLSAALGLVRHGAAHAPAPRPIPVLIPPLRFGIANRTLTCDDCTITLGPSRSLVFSGSTDLAGPLHLRLTLSPDRFADTGAELGAGTVEVPITGTVDDPKLEKP